MNNTLDLLTFLERAFPAGMNRAFPACAGMNRIAKSGSGRQSRVSRMCGDEPPNTSPVSSPCLRFPHVRG